MRHKGERKEIWDKSQVSGLGDRVDGRPEWRPKKGMTGRLAARDAAQLDM